MTNSKIGFFTAILFIAVGILFSTGCMTAKQQRIRTAYKVAKHLQACEISEVRKFYSANPDELGGDVEKLQAECIAFKYVTSKYGFPARSSVVYKENFSDPVETYVVEYPIFKGNDTLWSSDLYSITLKVYFGPDNIYKPTEIRYFKVEYDIKINWEVK